MAVLTGEGLNRLRAANPHHDAIARRRVLDHVPPESVGEKKRIEKGQVFVRHGSLTVEPTDEELQALLEEGERARKESR